MKKLLFVALLSFLVVSCVDKKKTEDVVEPAETTVSTEVNTTAVDTTVSTEVKVDATSEETGN